MRPCPEGMRPSLLDHSVLPHKKATEAQTGPAKPCRTDPPRERALAVLLALAVGLGLAQPLSGFALERIVHHVEASEGAPASPQKSFLVNLQRRRLLGTGEEV